MASRRALVGFVIVLIALVPVSITYSLLAADWWWLNSLLNTGSSTSSMGWATNLYALLAGSLVLFSSPVSSGPVPLWPNVDKEESLPTLSTYNVDELGVTLQFPLSPAPPSVDHQISPVLGSTPDHFDPNNWVLYTTEFRNNSFAVQPYSANGYIGARIPVHGHGLAFDENLTDPNGNLPTNGWPLFDRRFTGAYVAGFWDYQTNITATNFPELLKKGGESVISTLPVWTTLDVTDLKSNKTYNTSTTGSEVSNWIQSLSLKNGIVQTNLTWTPDDNTDTSYQLNYTIATHRSRPNLGIVRLDITPTSNSTIELTDILDGAGSMRTDFVASDISLGPSIWTAVKPIGIRNVTAFEFSTLWFSETEAVNFFHRNGSTTIQSQNDSTIAQQFQVSLTADNTFTVIKYVGVASSDAFPDDPFIAAKAASSRAVRIGWDQLVREHNDAWDRIWSEADIVVPGDPEIQISTRASLFHLLANVRQGNETEGMGDNSISVGGLSSDSYAGFIFWDADTWMNPGLQALFPNFASSINRFRSKFEAQAVANAQSQNFSGAVFPWTSSRFGNCTSTGPCFDYVSLTIDYGFFLISNLVGISHQCGHRPGTMGVLFVY
jgi:trehalose/maltose hydrolase-like predicted phosphorylase